MKDDKRTGKERREKRRAKRLIKKERKGGKERKRKIKQKREKVCRKERTER